MYDCRHPATQSRRQQLPKPREGRPACTYAPIHSEAGRVRETRQCPLQVCTQESGTEVADRGRTCEAQVDREAREAGPGGDRRQEGGGEQGAERGQVAVHWAGYDMESLQLFLARDAVNDIG